MTPAPLTPNPDAAPPRESLPASPGSGIPAPDPTREAPAFDARALHLELCREWGRKNIGRELTADEIIADWNSRSPEDQW